MLKKRKHKTRKENLPVSYQFEGIGSTWRALHSTRKHAISSPLMTCESCLVSRVMQDAVQQDPLNLENPKEAFSAPCCATAM